MKYYRTANIRDNFQQASDLARRQFLGDRHPTLQMICDWLAQWLGMQGDRKMGFDWSSFVETLRRDKISSKKWGLALAPALLQVMG